MRRILLIIIICLLTVHFSYAEEGLPSVQVVSQKLHHCGPACAETILREYGINDPWVGQTVIAAALCARLPEYKSRHPEAKDALERYYPDFVETYQPELAELLMDHDYCVINIRKSIDPATGKPMESVWDVLKSHLAQGHMAIVHIPKHYLAVILVDNAKQELYFIDPLMPERSFPCSFTAFSSGAGFHKRSDGSPHGGWDGRTLIFWEGKSINQKDRCPICGEMSGGVQFTYCRKCGCFINRRASNVIQKAIDVISTCIEENSITRVDGDRLKAKFGSLRAQRKYKETDLKQALLNYPLVGQNPNRLETLNRYNEDKAMDLDKLSLDDLMEIISAGDKWKRELEARLSGSR